MAARLLSDSEIVTAMKLGDLKVSNIDPEKVDLSKKDCPIQPSSLDLRIGYVYLPPSSPFDLDRLGKGQPHAVRGAKIQPGHSAIVETAEELTLSARLSAFGFPPAHLSQGSVLMTNPGHIDPGYSGKLTFTIINLGREDLQLDTGMVIATFLIFQFEGNGVSCDYSARRNESAASMPPQNLKRATTLNKLSPDFGDFSRRINVAAEKAVENHSVRLGWAKLWLPALTGAATVVALWVSSLFPTLASIASDKELDAAVAKLEQSIADIQDELKVFDNRIGPLESSKLLLDIDQRLDELSDEIEELR